MSFAKIYESDKVGQILLKHDVASEDEYESEIRVYFQPEGQGVCSIARAFDSWEKSEKAWEDMRNTQAKIEEIENIVVQLIDEYCE
jgi:hypothetical protein